MTDDTDHEQPMTDPRTDGGSGTGPDDDGEAVEILLAEDNPNDVRMTKRAFEKGKFLNNIHVAEDGVEALAFLRREGEYADEPRPDIILLDLEMPRMDGKEVLAELEDDPDLAQIPVIVLTSSEAERDVIESYKHSANAYMTKPVGYEAFQETVREIEQFWFELVKLPGER
jgi:CheY-like chemotaxis protein